MKEREKLEDEPRFEVSKKRYEEIMKRIGPFTKTTTSARAYTTGRWIYDNRDDDSR